MTYREIRAEKMRSALLSMGILSAESMTEEEACRAYARLERGTRSRGRPLNLNQIAAKSTHARRAAQTHPGKR